MDATDLLLILVIGWMNCHKGSFYCILSIFMPHSEGHVLAMSWLLDLSERKWILNYVRPCFIFRQMGAQWHTLCSHHIKSPTFLDFHDKQTAFHKRDESALSNSNFAKHVLKLFKRWAPLTFAHVYFSSGSHIILLQQGTVESWFDNPLMSTVKTCYSVTYISVALWSCFSIYTFLCYSKKNSS